MASDSCFRLQTEFVLAAASRIRSTPDFTNVPMTPRMARTRRTVGLLTHLITLFAMIRSPDAAPLIVPSECRKFKSGFRLHSFASLFFVTYACVEVGCPWPIEKGRPRGGGTAMVGALIETTNSRFHDEPVEVSVVMPCLNEARTVGVCIDKALACLQKSKVKGEVVVADNGSTDGSQDIARAHGARVVPVERKGYGSALQGGIAAANGKFIISGEAA